MAIRKDAVSLAVASLLLSAGFATAETSAPKLSLTPTVTAQETAPRAPLMSGLDALGVGKSLDNYGLNIYGWFESGYTYNVETPDRLSSVDGNAPKVALQPFTHQAGDNYMLNQLVVRFERLVDTKKWDVGGMVELMYGEDASAIHAGGLPWNGNDPSQPGDDRFHPKMQFDIVQAYVDIGVPVGNGLKIRAGKFTTLIGYEYIAAPFNPLYSKSLLFNVAPFTHTGVLAYYTINDQWSVVGGITRGWDMALEDTNGAIDFLGQIAYTPNKQWSFYLNTSVGPQNTDDESHYRTMLDFIANWNMSDRLSFGAEALYLYDGGINAGSYGDSWGAALYAKYIINEMFTANLRAEKLHDFRSGVSLNFYEITAGVTIKPFPKDRWGSNLIIRPEVRYDYCEDEVFDNGGSSFDQNQFTIGADIIITF